MPFGSSKAAILGASGAGGFTLEVASGSGTATESGGYKYYTFTDAGTLSIEGTGEIDVLCRLTVSETDQEGGGAEATQIVGAGDPAGFGLGQVPRVDEGRQQRRYCRQG